jgi:hypothetical protein
MQVGESGSMSERCRYLFHKLELKGDWERMGSGTIDPSKASKDGTEAS